MTDVVRALYALSAAAAVSAVALAARAREHRPVTGLLLFGLGGDLLTRWLRPAGGWGPHPLAGAARASFHAAQLCLAAYPWAVLACAALVLGRARPHRVAVWIGAPIVAYFVALVSLYRPLALWGVRVDQVYAGAELVVVVGLGVLVTRWALALRAARRVPSAAEVVVIAAAGAEAMNLFGPFLLGFKAWPTMARSAYALCYAVACIVQGGALWRLRSRSDRSSGSASGSG